MSVPAAEKAPPSDPEPKAALDTAEADLPSETPAFIARWDLDKTYLRTDFDTLRDLWRTAWERPDQKRTVPGAAALLRELGRENVETHILSGSPEQLRDRLTEKLRLDGARPASLTLKPNLQNLMRLRFRALRGQLGYKLPSLLEKRAEVTDRGHPHFVREILLGDDAEADAYVYSLYGAVCDGQLAPEDLRPIMRAGAAYDDTIEHAIESARAIDKGPVVARILIHLDRQSSPEDFAVYGEQVVPFYNYLQAAFILQEDGVLSPQAVLAVATSMLVRHNFDGSALARSYRDLIVRGHLSGGGLAAIEQAAPAWLEARGAAAERELSSMLTTMTSSPATPMEREPAPALDYLALAKHHNRRKHRR